MGLGITTINNISNTLGYIYSIKNENVLDINASFPQLSTTPYPIPYWTTYTFSTTTLIELASININELGMYLLYVNIPFWVIANDNDKDIKTLYTAIMINNVIIEEINDKLPIRLYRKTTSPSDGINSGYVYNKIFMCNITSANSKLSMSIKLPNANNFYIHYTYNSTEFYFKYYAIKIS